MWSANDHVESEVTETGLKKEEVMSLRRHQTLRGAGDSLTQCLTGLSQCQILAV